MATLRQKAGALLFDWPPFLWHLARGDWTAVHNRKERITPAPDGPGWRCEWVYTSDLHLPKVFPSSAMVLTGRALSEWPITLSAGSPEHGSPVVSFVIGHRGLSRLPHLLCTLRSIAAQRGPDVECIVVEQSSEREIESHLPAWVRYVHTPIADPAQGYNRAWAFNVAARSARGEFLVLHDNDMLVPESYAAEIVRRMGSWDFADLKRLIFYLDETSTARIFATHRVPNRVNATVVQNLQGASIVARRRSYEEIGGFDEMFVGWGGEDNEFWERANAAHKVRNFGYLPFVHLHHPPQPGKLMGEEAPAVRRYRELTRVPASDRIRRLLARSQGDPSAPYAEE